jgi:hypothetical protein
MSLERISSPLLEVKQDYANAQIADFRKKIEWSPFLLAANCHCEAKASFSCRGIKAVSFDAFIPSWR